MSSPKQEKVLYATYLTDASIPTAAQLVAGGMTYGTEVAAVDTGRVRRLTNNNGTPLLVGAGAATPGFVGTATVLLGTSSLDVLVSGMTATGVVMLSLEGAFDATMTRVTYTPAAGKFTITGNANATAATKVGWSVASLS